MLSDCRILGSDARQTVDAAATEPVARALQREDVAVVTDEVARLVPTGARLMVVTFGVAADGRREVLGFEDGDTESRPFWTTLLRSLKARGTVGFR